VIELVETVVRVVRDDPVVRGLGPDDVVAGRDEIGLDDVVVASGRASNDRVGPRDE